MKVQDKSVRHLFLFIRQQFLIFLQFNCRLIKNVLSLHHETTTKLFHLKIDKMKTTKNPTHTLYYSKDGLNTYSQEVYGKVELHHLIDCFLKDGFTYFDIRKLLK